MYRRIVLLLVFTYVGPSTGSTVKRVCEADTCANDQTKGSSASESVKLAETVRQETRKVAKEIRSNMLTDMSWTIGWYSVSSASISWALKPLLKIYVPTWAHRFAAWSVERAAKNGWFF